MAVRQARPGRPKGMRFFAHDPSAERRKGLIQFAVGLMVMGAPLAGIFLYGGHGVPARIFGTGVGGSIFGLCLSIVGLFTLRDARTLAREEAIRKATSRPLPVSPRPVPAPRPAAYRGSPGRASPDPEPLPPVPARRLLACSVFIVGLILPMPLGLFRAFTAVGASAFVLMVAGLGVSGFLVAVLRGLWRYHPLAWSAGHLFFLFFLLLAGAITATEVACSGFSPFSLVGTGAGAYFCSALVAFYALRRDWLLRLDALTARNPLAGHDKAALAAQLRLRRARS